MTRTVTVAACGMPRWACGMRSRLADERGSIATLAIGYAAIALAAALLLAAAADLYLARKQLFAAADAAALAAVAQLDWDSVRLSDAGVAVALDADAATATASEWLAANGPDRVGGAEVVVVQSSGDTLALTVRGHWSPPVLSIWVPELVPIEVEVSARGRLS